jgi:hypothetical protein
MLFVDSGRYAAVLVFLELFLDPLETSSNFINSTAN